MFKRKKRDGMGIGLADNRRKSPLRADEQDAPEPERPMDSAKDQQQGRSQHPSQAEGERNR